VDSAQAALFTGSSWSDHTTNQTRPAQGELPAKTPRPVIDKLTAWFNQIAASDDAKKFLSNLGADPLLGSPKMVDEMLAKETSEWRDYVKLAKIEPQ
jgi:hypothetical protein